MRVAVIADAHLAYHEISPGLNKLTGKDDLAYTEYLLEELGELEKLIDEGELQKIILNGDIFDFASSDGLSALMHAYIDSLNGNGSPEKGFERIGNGILTGKIDRKKYESRQEAFFSLVDRVRRLIAEDKLVYIAGNHEYVPLLKEAGIKVYGSATYGDVVFEHGDRLEKITEMFGWGKNGFPKIFGSSDPYRKTVPQKVRGVMRDCVRIYGYFGTYLKKLFGDVGKYHKIYRKRSDDKLRITAHLHREIFTENIVALGDHRRYGTYFVDTDGKNVRIYNPSTGKVWERESGKWKVGSGYTVKASEWGKDGKPDLPIYSIEKTVFPGRMYAEVMNLSVTETYRIVQYEPEKAGIIKGRSSVGSTERELVGQRSGIPRS